MKYLVELKDRSKIQGLRTNIYTLVNIGAKGGYSFISTVFLVIDMLRLVVCSSSSKLENSINGYGAGPLWLVISRKNSQAS
jgi:hypothetical protein